MFDISLSYLYELFYQDCMVWKIWLTNCYACATPSLLVNSRRTDSLNASQSSVRVIRVDTTTRGLSAKIRRSLASGLPLYGTSRLNIVL